MSDKSKSKLKSAKNNSYSPDTSRETDKFRIKKVDIPLGPFVTIYFRFPNIGFSAITCAKVDLGSESFISETLFSTLFPGKKIHKKSRLNFFLFDEEYLLNFMSLQFSTGKDAINGWHLILGENGLSKYLVSNGRLILKNELTKIPIYLKNKNTYHDISWQKLEDEKVFAITPPDRRPYDDQNLADNKDPNKLETK